MLSCGVWPIYRLGNTIDAASSIVSVSVGHTGEPFKNGRTDQDAVWGRQTRVGSRNYVSDEGAHYHHLAMATRICLTYVAAMQPYVKLLLPLVIAVAVFYSYTSNVNRKHCL